MRISSLADIPNSSAFDHYASGTLDEIPGSEYVDPITALDEHYDARSETGSISSLSSQITVLSNDFTGRESLVSVRFWHLRLGLNMNIRELVQYLRYSSSKADALLRTICGHIQDTILDMTPYLNRSPSMCSLFSGWTPRRVLAQIGSSDGRSFKWILQYAGTGQG